MKTETDNRRVSELIEKLRKELPPAWDRTRTTELTGGIVNARTLANLMSQRKGPAGTVMFGKKRIITRGHFLAWLEPQLKPNRQGGGGLQIKARRAV